MAWSRIVPCVLFVSLAALSAACSSSSDSNPSGGGSGGTSASGGSGGSSGSGGATGGAAGTGGGTGGGAQCTAGPGYPSSDGPHLVSTATATILDLDGQPAKKTLAQICGLDICINGSTNDQGEIVTCDSGTGVCGTGINPAQEEKRPALKYGDGIGYVKFALLLPTNTSDYTLGTQVTAKLPSSGVDFVPGGDATSGNITLTLPAGGVAKVDKLTYGTPDVQKFRAVEIPAAKAPAAVDATQNFEIIVGTTPVETKLCPPAKLSVPNTPNWPAGTAVEFWIHGVDPGEEWAPYAGWAKVSGGTVSADGKTVVTNDGEGVPLLSVFGVKKK